MSIASAGVVVGIATGVALLLLLSWVDARRAPSLPDRLGPYLGVRGRAHAAGRLDGGAAGLVLDLIGLGRSEADPDDDADLDLRLARAGRTMRVVEYRLERGVWAGLGAGLGLFVTMLARPGDRATALAVLLSGIGALGGWLACDLRLARQVRGRRTTIDHHLPAFAELLALAVAAGASTEPALRRAGDTVGGPLGAEVTRAMADVRAGSTLPAALRTLAHRTGCASVQRLVEALLVAVERGTPLADVLRAQAMDARALQARQLVEQAGRKDVAMLVPVVFLVLPSVVLIAMYPGVTALRLVVP